MDDDFDDADMSDDKGNTGGKMSSAEFEEMQRDKMDGTYADIIDPSATLDEYDSEDEERKERADKNRMALGSNYNTAQPSMSN